MTMNPEPVRQGRMGPVVQMPPLPGPRGMIRDESPCSVCPYPMPRVSMRSLRSK